MSDALTVREVERLARAAQGRLYAVPWPGRVPDELAGIAAAARKAVDAALGDLNELLLLLDFVDDVEHGRAVIVDDPPELGPAGPAPASVAPPSSCPEFAHGSACTHVECLCSCHTIPPHTPRHRR